MYLLVACRTRREWPAASRLPEPRGQSMPGSAELVAHAIRAPSCRSIFFSTKPVCGRGWRGATEAAVRATGQRPHRALCLSEIDCARARESLESAEPIWSRRVLASGEHGSRGRTTRRTMAWSAIPAAFAVCSTCTKYNTATCPVSHHRLLYVHVRGARIDTREVLTTSINWRVIL